MNRDKIKQAVILAGGLGKRLQPFTDNNPKPMYPVNGKPFIGYLIEQVKQFGIDNILLLLGYMPEKITEYLKNGKDYGVSISYDITPVEFNTGDRIFHAKERLNDDFLLMYCDNYCPIDYRKLEDDFYNNNALIQVSVYDNKDNYTKNNMLLEENGKVLAYDKKRAMPRLQGVDIGYAIIKKKILDMVTCENQNFESVAYPYALRQNQMFATVTKHRYYSVGSWERIELTKKFFEDIPTVFIDRDGTINERPPKACYVENEQQFVWLKGAKEAIGLLNKNGYRVLMVTNQPGIARGKLSLEKLNKIHDKMERELEEEGAHIDKIYFCPHNWDEGCSA